jgi:hypothetical protein
MATGKNATKLDEEFELESEPCCEIAKLPSEVIEFVTNQRAKTKPATYPKLAAFLVKKGYGDIKPTRLENHWRRHVPG